MEDQLNGNHPDMALASFIIELEFLGHIHDQHRDWAMFPEDWHFRGEGKDTACVELTVAEKR